MKNVVTKEFEIRRDHKNVTHNLENSELVHP